MQEKDGIVTRRRHGFVRLALALAATVSLLAWLPVSPASAGQAPTWLLATEANSTAAQGSMLTFYLERRDYSSIETAPGFAIKGVFPVGLRPVSAVGFNEFEQGECHVEAHVITCEFAGPDVQPGYPAMSEMTVEVEPQASGRLASHFEIYGGGIATPGRSAAVTEVSSAPPAFGLHGFDGLASSGPGGDPLTGVGPAPVTQAGAHPYSSTTNLEFTMMHSSNGTEGDRTPPEPPKDVLANLPPGFVGNPTTAARCRLSELANGIGQTGNPLCPPESQVGIVFPHLDDGQGIRGLLGPGQNLRGPAPLYNMIPPPGMPAQFGFSVSGSIVLIDARLRVEGGPGGLPVYGLAVDSKDIPEALVVNGATVTFWGTPSDPSHTPERSCSAGGNLAEISGGVSCTSHTQPRAFLRNPTSCTAPGEGLKWVAHVDSWANPGRFEAGGNPDLSDPAWKQASYVTHAAPGYPNPESEWGPVTGIEGCDKVPFTPSIQVQPTSAAAQGPTGLDVNLSMPQQGLSNPSAIAQADVRKVVVALPEGVTLNPASADGLQACSPSQIALLSLADPTCPPASKLGDVEVQAPPLLDALEGSLYLATPHDNPFGSLVALYLVIKADGVIVKTPGRVDTDPQTGRVTTTFEGLPQLPFSAMHLTMKAGPHAPLSNPLACGTQPMSFTLEGWNGTTVKPGGSYPVDCRPGLGAFKPTFVAGTTNNAAGAFSPFTLSFSTDEDEQQIHTLRITLPPGVLAKLASVTRCQDAQADTGTCPPNSLIGHVTVGVGTGPEPYTLSGNIYLTGPYKGAPVGEAVVVRAVAGPFDLGTVVVRGAVDVDPRTAQPIITVDPLPRFVGDTGLPTTIRRVVATLDRPGFVFNPTNCKELSAVVDASGVQGTAVSVPSRFQAANCANLAFKPKFTASTSAKVSRSQGASLRVKVTYPKGAEANIRSVKVKLPRHLASRLTTLQHACPDSVFEANPAACPAGSLVGHASAVTPVYSYPLVGPAYFVSHGGAKFPELVVVLQGEGVTIQLHGETFIDEHSGVTSSTFRSIPDAPVSAFELSLPRGSYSALGSSWNLCKGKLVMPTVITGQNGAVIRQSTRIGVSGCGKPKANHRKGRARR